jgi:glycosyltransferase 2 family protein
MKNLIIALSKAAVTALLFYLLFRRVDFHEFAGVLRNAQLHILLLAFMVLWIGHYLCIIRWRMLMRPVMPTPSAGNLWGIYCIGLFFNLAFPAVVGGDVVKMYYAGKPSKRFAQSFAATFLDRDAGMLAMMIIACTAVLIRPMDLPGIPVRFIVWTVFLTFVFANIAIFTPFLHRLLTKMLNKAHLSRMAAKIDTISNVFRVMGKHWTVLVNSLAVSLINQLLVISVTWLMAEGLRIHVSLFEFLVFVPVVTLISMIPVSLNGMGLREYAYVSLLGAIGVGRESSVALGLLASAFTFLSGIPGGVVYVFFRNRSDVQQMAALETDFSWQEKPL